MQRIHYDGSSEIGAFATLTSSYCVVGASHTSQFYNEVLEYLQIPVIETTINGIRAVGNQIQGNKHGLLVPSTTLDHELISIRRQIPENVRVRRIDERLNALGNIILCNDHVAIIHPEVDNETIEIIENVLNVKAFKMCIGEEPLVGTYAAMNNQGLMVCTSVSDEDQLILSQTLGLQVCAGTVNTGSGCLGGGMILNDVIGFCGRLTSNFEVSIIEKIFLLNNRTADTQE